jgi:hypothetical protein
MVQQFRKQDTSPLGLASAGSINARPQSRIAAGSVSEKRGGAIHHSTTKMKPFSHPLNARPAHANRLIRKALCVIPTANPRSPVFHHATRSEQPVIARKMSHFSHAPHARPKSPNPLTSKPLSVRSPRVRTRECDTPCWAAKCHLPLGRARLSRLVRAHRPLVHVVNVVNVYVWCLRRALSLSPPRRPGSPAPSEAMGWLLAFSPPRLLAFSCPLRARPSPLALRPSPAPPRLPTTGDVAGEHHRHRSAA